MENKLSKTFEELVNTLDKYCLYQQDDEVADDIRTMRAVIVEVNKRLTVINTMANYVSNLITVYQDAVDSKNPFTMDVNHYDRVLNLGMEMITLTDLDNNQAVEENWENVFNPKTIEDKLTDIYVDFNKIYRDFHYDSMNGTCHISNGMEISYNCTPFWDNAEGISIVQYRDSNYLTSYIIPFKKPTNEEELEAFEEFYSVQVDIMRNSLYN